MCVGPVHPTSLHSCGDATHQYDKHPAVWLWPAMQIDGNRKVVSFAEKPKGDALKEMMVDTTVLGLSKEEAEAKPFIASMGIYVFKKGVLGELASAVFPACVPESGLTALGTVAWGLRQLCNPQHVITSEVYVILTGVCAAAWVSTAATYTCE
eukprot:GHRQ01033932.1.p1 GENE.GHRQ01033932.1~~GHRQ01033932.1.p1  ORF type:complete len:153 (-),score=55.75 GHRQ01033932.1:190-648(-)